jgi:hypothetical protein
MPQPQAAYMPPALEQHHVYSLVTGVSLPIGAGIKPEFDTIEFNLEEVTP